MHRLAATLLFVICLIPTGMAQGLTPKSDPQALNDLRIGTGEKNIFQAWFILPTTRYRHFVLGSQYEAAGLRVRLRSGEILTLELDDAHVFEDRQPRLADLDGDGEDEIIVVQTSLSQGASLAAYAVANGALKLKAQTPYIGQAFRWLNPAGIADFDGDGILDVSFVAMPHLVKRLEFWSLVNGKFTRWGAFSAYSNHRNGSQHTDMSAVADFNDDGVADLALPGVDRRSVEFLSLADRALNVLKSVPLPAPADGAFSFTENNIIVQLSTGRNITIER